MSLRFLRALLYLPTALAPAALVALMLVTARPVAAAQHSVRIVDDAFSPGSITVAVGDTVTWTNTGEDPHTVTAADGSFDSGRLDPGQSFSFTFTAAGAFGYRCDFHSDMTAQVVVEGAAPAPAEPAPPAADGAPQPAGGTDAGADAAPAGGAHGGHAATVPVAGAATTADGAAPDTAMLPEPFSPGIPAVLLGVGVFYTALVVALDSAARRR